MVNHHHPVCLSALLATAILIGTPTTPMHASSSDCSWNNLIDLGSYYTRNWAASDATGWQCAYWDGDVNWWTIQFDLTHGEFFPTIGKGTFAKSTGYPKRLDSTGDLYCYANATIKDWGMTGNWGWGVTLWLDASNPTTWPFTHEIMIFERYGNLAPWSFATKLGTVYVDGSDYDVYGWLNPDGIRSYQALRLGQRTSGWLNAKGITAFLRQSARGEWQIPNNFIDHVVWGFDSTAATGKHVSAEVSVHSISIPNL